MRAYHNVTVDDCEPEYPSDTRYTVDGYKGVAFHAYGWHTEPDEDTHWSGYSVRTGNLIMVMVGDDFPHQIDPDDVSPIPDSDYCHECGQIGCTADGR